MVIRGYQYWLFKNSGDVFPFKEITDITFAVHVTVIFPFTITCNIISKAAYTKEIH